MGSAELASTSAGFIAIIKFPLHQERINSRVGVRGLREFSSVGVCVRVRTHMHVQLHELRIWGSFN